MRFRAGLVLAVFLMAGCTDPGQDAPLPEPQLPPTAFPPPNATNAPEAVDIVRENLPTWVALGNCTEIHFGFPASHPQPTDEWFPEGLRPAPLVGPIHSYNFFLWRCQDILIDNQTLERDAHMLIVETAVQVPQDHPHRGPHDQLMIEGYSDAPALATHLKQEGFPVHEATFQVREENKSIDVAVSGMGFQYILTAGIMVEGENPPLSLDVRMHARARDTGAHLFFDLLRFPQGGAKEAAPRGAVAQIDAEWLDDGSQILGGIASTKQVNRSLRIPVFELP